MNQLIAEAFAFVFNQHFVNVSLVAGITLLACIVSILHILAHWGR
ncbi:hypothetical protein [Bacillus sp. FJAT-27264]|nr:hypothetical protein [Bacillus sp. FJAT-27264]